jgi:small-conductance mechanosensitive channel
LMAEATIEIAFPQVDVHLRAASLPVPPATSDRITSAT